MIEKKAYAKINLFLDVENLRYDGYHNIKSIMQTIDWYDIIRVEKNSSENIKIVCNDKSIPLDNSNTVYKATTAFMERLKANDGILIQIQKNIPISAGMAGGSADGAKTLEALNEIYKFPFSKKELTEIGRKIGADVPFCLMGGTKKASGIGDVIEECCEMPECFIVCAKTSDSNVSTVKAYKKLDSVYCDFVGYEYDEEKYREMITSLSNKDLGGVCKNMFNIFEDVISYENTSVIKIKKTMQKYGAINAMMSGSGPSVFGIFDDKKVAEKLCDELIQQGATAKVCTPINALNF